MAFSKLVYIYDNGSRLWRLKNRLKNSTLTVYYRWVGLRLTWAKRILICRLKFVFSHALDGDHARPATMSTYLPHRCHKSERPETSRPCTGQQVRIESSYFRSNSGQLTKQPVLLVLNCAFNWRRSSLHWNKSKTRSRGYVRFSKMSDVFLCVSIDAYAFFDFNKRIRLIKP